MYSGGAAISTTVSSDGQEVVDPGGAPSFTTVSSGGVEVLVDSSNAVSTTLGLGGAIDVAYLATPPAVRRA